MNPTEHKVYMCSVCGEYYHAKEQAETCCVGEKCPECGAQRDYQFSPLCNKCRQKERDRFYAEQQKARWEAARKVPLSQYDGQELYCNLNDCYYATTDYEEMVDALFAEERISAPEFPADGVYGCYETKLGLVPEQVEALMEESDYAYEDFELSDAACRDIKAFCESFNEKYAETVYFPNWSVGVVKD